MAQVHSENKILRFWNLPIDAPSVWGPLYDANVDLINTDNLTGLSTYIQSLQTQAVPEPSLSIALLGVLGTSLLLKRRAQSQSLIDPKANKANQ